MSTLIDQQPDGQPDEQPQPQQERRRRAQLWLAQIRRRRWWWIAGTLATLLVTILSIPTIVAHTPLRNRVLRSVFADLHGTITSRTASLGWFSATRLYDVEIRDAEGHVLFQAPLVEGTASVRQLLGSSDRLGHFRLDRPQVQIELTDQGSNVEEVFAAWISDESASGACPQIELEIIDATVSIHDVPGDRKWQLAEVDASLNLAQDWAEPMQLKASGELPQPDRTSRVRADVTLERKPAAEGAAASSGLAILETEALPLALLESLTRRALPDAHVSGWLSSKLRYEWGNNPKAPQQALIAGEINTEDLTLTAPQLGTDRLRLSRLKVPCQLAWEGDHLDIQKLSIDCDVGQAALEGAVHVDLDQEIGPAVLAAAMKETYQLNGRLDLARLAEILPDTLRIREGTRITAGNVQVNLSRKQQTGGAAWEGRVEMSNLMAINRGERLTWERPMRVNFAARDGDAGPVIDHLICESSFLQLEAAGTLEYMSVSAVYDLKQLGQELDRFIDLGPLELAGDGWSYISWKRSGEGQVETDGEFQVRNLAVTQSGGTWSEQNLVLLASLTGQADEQRLRRIDTATLDLESGQDRAKVHLTEAITNVRTTTPWPLEAKLQGQLNTWLARLTPWLGPLSDWTVAGEGELDARLTCATDTVEIHQASAELRKFQAQGHGMYIDEPVVQIDLAGAWDRAARRVELKEAKMVTSAVALDTASLVWAMPEAQAAEVSGTVNYSGDLIRLQSWFLTTAEPPTWLFDGSVRGRVEFAQAGAVITAKLTSTVSDLVISPEQGDPWWEPHAEVLASGQYDRKSDLFTLVRLNVDSDSLRGDANGRIAEVTGRRELDLRGRVDYDTLKLLELLRPYVGDGVQVVAGRDSRPFTVRATLNPPEASAAQVASVTGASQAPAAPQFVVESSVGWTGANVYGFQVGSGEIRGRLTDGLLQIAPLDFAVSDGRLAATPTMRLWPAPAVLDVQRGDVLRNVRISPEMCDRGLKYVAPVLAGVTETEGRFSVALDGCHVPLETPKQGDVAGRLTIHSVEIGASPVLQELITAVDTLRRLATHRALRPAGSGLSRARLTRESVVTFRMVEGRVYHRDLELAFDDVVVRTQGSVGLDQSLSLLAEVPVPAKWIGNNPVSVALRNQTLKLPIGGTLGRPKVDAKALQQITSQFLRTSAQDMLLDGLNGQLNKLIGPR